MSEARPISDQPLEDSAPDGSPLRRCLARAASGITAGMIHPVTCFVAFTALILGAFILPTQGIGLSMCALKTTAGIPCPGCGLTRSVTGVFHGRFLAGDPVALGLAGFIAIFWLLRVIVDCFYFNHSDWPAGPQFVAGHALLTSLFAFLVLVYGAVGLGFGVG